MPSVQCSQLWTWFATCGQLADVTSEQPAPPCGHGGIRADTTRVSDVPGSGSARSDEALIAASKAEPASFGELFDRYADEIYRYIARRLGGDVAPDLAAEVFLIAFRGRGGFEPSLGLVRPWLYGIAIKVIGRHHRGEMRRNRAFARLPQAPEGESFEDRAAERLDAQKLAPDLARALTRLSTAERDLLLLVAWADLSYDEAAQALGMPPGTVRSRMHRLRVKLRGLLEIDGGRP
jgi:RNA polymerase sigma factor (sigma-70 family)